VVFHHAGHTHPFLGPVQGVCSGSFTIPRSGETSAETYYEVLLTVRDSGAPLGTAGALDTTTAVQVRPNTSTLNFTTVPNPNLLITLDGVLQMAPLTTSGVVDFLRIIGAPASQVGPDGRTYTFASWSDGGMMTHTISTPVSTATWTASFTCNVITEVTGLLVNQAPGNQLALAWQPSADPCAAASGVRYLVYAAPTARPATLPGSFPSDPAFSLRGMTTTESFTYFPDPSDAFFLVVAVGTDGSIGLAGHYGN
jgi:hypothetical protein